jgi:1-acyl-sn-glycerol-3-phosphate acyltransferase
MIQSARSAAVYACAWLYMALAVVLCLPYWWITRRLGFVYACARLGIRLLLWFSGVRVVVEGREHLPAANAGIVYMANHQSYLDPPILLAALPGQLAFLAKAELFRVPLLGLVLRAGGLIPIDRRDRAAATASIARAAASVRAGRPILIFPEGTRSRDGRLLPFKKGPFYLAEQAQAPVVAVRVDGAAALLPRGEWRIRPGTVQVRIASPLDPAAWIAAPDPRATLAQWVQARLQA